MEISDDESYDSDHFFSLQAVKSVADKGKICILDVDIQGILSLKKTDLGCRYIFISPPSIEVRLLSSYYVSGW